MSQKNQRSMSSGSQGYTDEVASEVHDLMDQAEHEDETVSIICDRHQASSLMMRVYRLMLSSDPSRAIHRRGRPAAAGQDDWPWIVCKGRSTEAVEPRQGQTVAEHEQIVQPDMGRRQRTPELVLYTRVVVLNMIMMNLVRPCTKFNMQRFRGDESR